MPDDGITGQILEKTDTGTQWTDKPSGGMSQIEADARYLQLSGGTMTGDINTNGNRVVFGGTYPSYIENNGTYELKLGRISQSGGETNGVVTLRNLSVETPSSSTMAANKAYVDSRAPDILPISRGGTGVSSMEGIDYSVSRPRGIVLQNTEPSTVPNGCLVGVYE